MDCHATKIIRNIADMSAKVALQFFAWRPAPLMNIDVVKSKGKQGSSTNDNQQARANEGTNQFRSTSPKPLAITCRGSAMKNMLR